MSIAPDESERARAAVAIACLQWLRCTGPALQPARVAPRHEPPPMNIRAIAETPRGPTHPLWDFWLDG